MALTFSIGPTASCCTGKQIMYVADCNTLKTNKDWLNALEKCSHLQELLRLQDFALFWGITTASQSNSSVPFYRKLGFTEAFLAPKTTQPQRHKESGSLTMWCITPDKLRTNYDDLIKSLRENQDTEGLDKAELDRRRSFEEFAFYKFARRPIFRKLFPETQKIRSTDVFPTAMQERRELFADIIDMTGGFNPSQDPLVVRSLAGLTWGIIKERALLYRTGKI